MPKSPTPFLILVLYSRSYPFCLPAVFALRNNACVTAIYHR